MREGGQLEEKIINHIACWIIRFIMHEPIHQLGKYHDPDDDVEKMLAR
jgi:hypothetical protein